MVFLSFLSSAMECVLMIVQKNYNSLRQYLIPRCIGEWFILACMSLSGLIVLLAVVVAMAGTTSTIWSTACDRSLKFSPPGGLTVIV